METEELFKWMCFFCGACGFCGFIAGFLLGSKLDTTYGYRSPWMYIPEDPDNDKTETNESQTH